MENIPALLEITDQQFDILKAVDSASAKKQSKPKDIQRIYENLSGKLIQKPNLFAQLRELQKQGFLVKSETGYSVNKIKLKQSLQGKKQVLKTEADSCDILTREIDSIFKAKPAEVRIYYVTRDELLKLNITKVKESKRYFRTGHIPDIAYSPLSQQINGLKEYATLKINLCKQGKLKIKYIKSLDPERIFFRVLEKLGDKNLAYREVKLCYENLIKLLKMPNLEMRYLPASIESFRIFEDDLTTTLVFPLRALPHQISGAIIIESKNIGEAYKQMFNTLFENATPLTKELIRRIAKQKLEKLRELMKTL